MAIDQHDVYTLSGGTWSETQVLETGNIGLLGLSCASTSFCMADDGYGNVYEYNSGTWTMLATEMPTTGPSISCTVEQYCAISGTGSDLPIYNGLTWTATNVDGSSSAVQSVSCTASLTPTAVFCLAAVDTAIYAYDGTSWTISMNVPQAGDTVSCAPSAPPSDPFCSLVDAGGNAYTLSGSTWSAEDDIDGTTRIADVSCPAQGSCMAIDWTDNEMTLSAGTWSTPSTVDAAANGNSSEATISCPEITWCVIAPLDGYGTAAALQNGSWTTSRPDASHGYPTAISCPTPTFCALVDEDGNAFLLNGSTWTAPNPLSELGFSRVSCASPSLCVALTAQDAYVYQGGVWGAPTPLTPSANLTSVSCVTTTRCVVVAGDGNTFEFDGTSWSVGPNDNNLHLRTVSCPTTTTCVAVDDTSGEVSTLSNAGWTQSSTVIDPLKTLFNVTCPAISFCGAIDEQGKILTETDGTWRAPLPKLGGYVLGSMSCPAAGDCVAVNASQDTYVLIDGVWSTVNEPDYLVGVSCASVASCYGFDTTGDVVQYGIGSLYTTATTFSLASSHPTVGSVKVSLKVLGESNIPGDGPLGDATVSDGVTDCTATLTTVKHTATGTCVLSVPTAGRVELTASYSGDFNWEASRSAALSTDVGYPTTTALTASKHTLTYGHEQVEHFTATVTAHGGTTSPTGSVSIKDGADHLCTASLRAVNGSAKPEARGTCTLRASTLHKGVFKVTASYPGSAVLAPSKSASTSVKVSG